VASAGELAMRHAVPITARRASGDRADERADACGDRHGQGAHATIRIEARRFGALPSRAPRSPSHPSAINVRATVPPIRGGGESSATTRGRRLSRGPATTDQFLPGDRRNRRRSGAGRDSEPPTYVARACRAGKNLTQESTPADATVVENGHAQGSARVAIADGSSWSAMRSVGLRTKTSQIMSGLCWLPLIKPITGRPVACSITAWKRSRMTS
jgi:hypothetical protein